LQEKVLMYEKVRFNKRSPIQITLIGVALLLSACGGAVKEPTEAPMATEQPPAVVESSPTPAAEIDPTEVPPTEMTPTEDAAEVGLFAISSSAFAHESPIPVRYSCDGDNTSPPLAWSDPPQGTQSFALIHDDPDAPAGTWVHWVLFNIPGDSLSLEGAIPAQETLGDGSLHGENSWGRRDYGGPCPPGGTHRYFFKLYALDTLLELEAGADKEALLAAMEGHILAEAELMGTFAR
jgi:Raf kinase inhibitor-like YbhB/YbcL family protein